MVSFRVRSLRKQPPHTYHTVTERGARRREHARGQEAEGYHDSAPAVNLQYGISLSFLVRLRLLHLLTYTCLGRFPILVIDDANHTVVTGAVSVSQFSGQRYSDLSSDGLINFTPNHPPEARTLSRSES